MSSLFQRRTFMNRQQNLLSHLKLKMWRLLNLKLEKKAVKEMNQGTNNTAVTIKLILHQNAMNLENQSMNLHPLIVVKEEKLLRVKSLKKRSLVAHYVPEVFSSRCKRKTIRVGRAGQGRVNGAATSDSISTENEKEEGKKKRTPYKYSPKPGNRYNPWICYVSLYRHKVQKRHPNATNKELIKILSHIYKEIPEVSS